MLGKLILLFCVVQSCISVRVTLRGGTTGTVIREAKQGESPVLECSASQSSGGDVNLRGLEWTYAKDPMTDGTHYIYNSLVVEKYADKAELNLPLNLQLKNVQSMDSGFYECRVTIPGDTPSVDSGTYNFTVLVPPHADISCGFPGDLKITIGSRAEFQCREKVAEAVPAPTYTWFKNDQALPESPTRTGIYANTSFTYNKNNGVLTFSKVTAGDAGTYYCVAQNKVGQAQCSAASITTKEQNVGVIVGIVFAVIFAILLIAVLVWWTWRRGYCDGFFEGKEPEDDGPDDGANDIMLDGHGPLVTKEPSEWSNGTPNKNSRPPSEHRMPEGAIRVMP